MGCYRIKILWHLLLGIATVTLEVNSCNKDEVELKLSANKQRQDSIHSKRGEERDSINTTRAFRLSLIKQYAEDISSGDSTRIKNANTLINLIDSSFAIQILNRPWYSHIEPNGNPVFNNAAKNLVTIQRDILLRYSNIKVYYKDNSSLNKAKSIDSLLRMNGSNSNVLQPDYSISNNEIVYYNVNQLNYCKAVQDLFKKSNYGEFEIRPSSGQAPTLNHFKIML